MLDCAVLAQALFVLVLALALAHVLLVFILTVDINHSIHIPVDRDHSKVGPIFYF